jgi:hypothetical protein
MAPYLETGDDAVIALARKEYRRKYKATWRKEKRRSIKEITTSWDGGEYKLLKEEAKRHKESITRFVKRATTGYMDTRYVVPDEAKVTKVMQLLALIYNRISELMDESTIPADAGKKVLFDVYQLEKDIRVTLYSPQTIEQVLKETVRRYPDKQTALIAFIQTLSV